MPPVCVEVYEEGLALAPSGNEGPKALFKFQRARSTLEIDWCYTPRSSPAISLEFGCLVGYVDLTIGHLVFVSEYDDAVSLPRFHFKCNRVRDVVMVPLVKSSCLETLQRYAKIGAGTEDCDEETNETDNVSLKDENQEPEVAHNQPGMIFTPTGILADSFKSKPQLSLNSQRILLEEFEYIDTGAVAKPNPMLDNLIYNKTFEHARSVKNLQRNAGDFKHGYRIPPALIRKFKRHFRRFFRNGGFYFSGDVNLTQNFSVVAAAKGTSYMVVPSCHESMKDLKEDSGAFFWNRSMLAPILESCPDTYPHVLCTLLIQGFVGTFDCTLKKSSPRRSSLLAGKRNEDSQTIPAYIVLVSRRSTDRAGVRYMRRGVDDAGKVANFVETDQCIFVDGPQETFYGRYTIIRGSIPLFFKQDPSKLQPAPIVQRSRDQNRDKLQMHFNHLLGHYGDFSCISLIEKGNRELGLGKTFQDLAAETDFPLAWFDFHEVCKGMHFENVELLMKEEVENSYPPGSVSMKLDQYGWYAMRLGRNLKEESHQKGVMRVNCIDCLDRTNIVSKFLCQKVLGHQLESWGVVIRNNKDFQSAYSNLWANNGDAISTQYASTNALKGDFTRAQKRHYTGVLNDAILTLSRYYYGYFSDFFRQIMIDFLLGGVGEEVFEQYESSLNNLDPNSAHETMITQKVIMDNTVSFLFRDSTEMLIGSWWVDSPFKVNTLRKAEMVGSMLLLTDRYVYLVVFAEADSVLRVYKIATEFVEKIQYGHYFLSSHTPLAKNPQKNVGIQLSFRKHEYRTLKLAKDVHFDRENLRMRQRADGAVLATSLSAEDFSILGIFQSQDSADSQVCGLHESRDQPSTLAIRFQQHTTHTEVRRTVSLLSRMCYGSSLVQSDLVTLEEAKSDTPFWKVLDHQLKKFIWA
ncbi:unnamed protein product [Kuraishia capsulata CBS 1993]|uniref:SAC domain-containing protein n=1 Tax=Kuraishia capsulata CBS 1993 TaxID=1382522 RepID=W6MGA9_9ASCO|nr:uncharacterized protein KUCA_T00001051001 [Kuraishia capsulata CBS 1993]CDK25084.1 unnamed protein product [Kuraishia capsulata CBS 1993]